MGDPQQGARACCTTLLSKSYPTPFFPPELRSKRFMFLWRGLGGGEKVNTQRAHGALGIGEEAFPQPPLLSCLTKDKSDSPRLPAVRDEP